jgi:hypothetical protein
MVFGYPEGVTVRSSLDTLEQLRHRVHETEQSRLAAHAEAERVAEAEQERARQVLLAATAQHEATRREEDHRLGGGGITAAEGQRWALWDTNQRKNRSLLWEEHARAVDTWRAAASQHERAKEALSRADAELRQVRERIEQRERTRRLGEEAVQQEAIDESSMRRFLEHRFPEPTGA